MEVLNGRKTYIGIAVALLPTLAGFFGFDVTSAFHAQFAPLVEELFVLFGSAIAVYGRMSAQSPGWLAKKKPE